MFEGDMSNNLFNIGSQIRILIFSHSQTAVDLFSFHSSGYVRILQYSDSVITTNNTGT